MRDRTFEVLEYQSSATLVLALKDCKTSKDQICYLYHPDGELEPVLSASIIAYLLIRTQQEEIPF